MSKLETNAEELAFLVDAVQDYAIFLLGAHGEIRSWNSGAERIFGYLAEEIVGQNLSRLYREADREKPRRELATAASEGRIEDEWWRVRKDGTRFWANTIVTVLRNKDGAITGFANVTRDLTERREADERLRQSEEMFSLLVASVRDYAIFMLDPQGHVVSWNAGAERIKGYRQDEIIGKHFSIFYPQEDIDAGKPERELAAALRDGRIEDEGWRARRDGTRVFANVVITAVFDRSGSLQGFAKVTRDITAKREAEETRRALLEQREARLLAEEQKRRLEDSYRGAQEANRAKDAFLMTLSHELRTPLTAILGWSRLLPNMQAGDPNFREAVAAINRSAKLQAELIDDILDVSRILSGKLRLRLENLDVLPVLHAALDAVRPSAEARRITLITSFEQNLGTITVDATRLQQIVWNLLSNAIKFTPKGGRVELSVRRSASQLQITVTDTGEGIESNFLPHVFEAFRQEESPSSRAHSGLGLGLSIVRYLTEAHGGSVFAESGGRGKGARFTITLPIHAVTHHRTEERNDAAHDTDSAELPSLAGRHIVVVDDDNEGRNLIAAVLRRAGATVIAVESARAALAYLEQHRPDIVLTDIAMPEIDGYALQRQLRQRKELANTRIVALTAFPARSATEDEQAFDTYLRKPIDPFELADRLSRLLRTA